jgi:hypothetical protein
VVSAKQRLDALSAEHIAVLTPLLYLSLRDLRELAQIAVAVGQVRDHGYGSITARIAGGRLALLELVLQSKPTDLLTEPLS